MTHFLSSPLLMSLAQGQEDSGRILPKVPESSQFWLPDAGSDLASSVDGLFMYIMWVSAISAMGIFAAMIIICVKYRAKDRAANQQALSQVDHSNALEITWSVLPFFFLISIFVWGFKDYVALRNAPKDAVEIYATAQKWKWLFKYPNGLVDSELHVPQDTNVRIIIKSVDVLHSLYIPQYRVKMDAVPGRYTELWFKANDAGTYPIFCTEYCGKQHSDMLSQAVVHPGDGYEKWLEDTMRKVYEETPPVELGKLMYNQFGCGACHSLDGSSNVGPTFQGVWGKTETLSSGEQVKVDENYVRQSILEPQSQIVQGFPPQMPSFKGQIPDKGIDGLIEYIKTIK